MQADLKNDAAVASIQPEVSKLTAFAQSLVIRSAEGYEQAGGYLKTIKGLLEQIEKARTRITKPLLEAQRAVNAQAKEAAEPLLKAESLIKRALANYQEEQERLRQEEQRRAEEAARKEREKLEQRAAKAAASGKVERAEQLVAQAAAVTAPVVTREAPKVAGIAAREVWKFRVKDPAALPREYLMPDERKIGAVVRALKGDTNIAGVEVWRETTIAAGAA